MSAHDARSRTLRYFSQMLVLVVIGLALWTIAAPRVYASPLCVNPGGTGGCFSTIQAAVTAVPPGGFITVAAGIYYEHDILVNKSLTITGAGSGNTIVDGQGLSRVFYLPLGSTVVSISGLAIQNGVNSGGAGGGIISGAALSLSQTVVYSNTATSGGGIENTGTLTLTNVMLSSNTATVLGGGGIQNGSGDAQMTLNDVFIYANRTAGPTRRGGGISLYNGSRAKLTNVSVYYNGAASAASNPTSYGGGIYAETGTILTIDRSMIASNIVSSGDGAGIYSEGTATLTNVTISGNSGNNANGGGIQNSGSGTVMLVNSTIVSNTLTGIIGSGGAINNSNVSGTSVQILNTILANNTTADLGPNCYGAVYSLGYNLENINSCGLTGTGDRPNKNPRIGPLANNGGPTLTHALLVGSPAIDGGTNSGCPSVDQRGVRRPLGARCDIGAYEAAMLYLPSLTKSGP